MNGKIKWKPRGSSLGSFEGQEGFIEEVIFELDHEGGRGAVVPDESQEMFIVPISCSAFLKGDS